MTGELSPNTQAILLLTAPLLAGGRDESVKPFANGAYNGIARALHKNQKQPADLLTPEADAIIRDALSDFDAPQIKRLLDRGFQLSQAVERWRALSIWVVSRADDDYPQRLRERLNGDAPPVLYGCGEKYLYNMGGLAVVGSRDINEELLEYTRGIGALAARSRQTLISGGARGVDQAAMTGALEAGGRVVGVLADSLEKAVMNRVHRDALVREQLTLISPYDPVAGFSAGNAMGRNKHIYALADAALVVESGFEEGGTWAGATDQLPKRFFVPVFIRSTGEVGKGLTELQRRGARPWPNPEDADEFRSTLRAESTQPSPRQELLPFDVPRIAPTTPQNVSADDKSPSETLFALVRDLLERLLQTPTTRADIVASLGVGLAQADAWLRRLVDEGILEQTSKNPIRYVTRQATLFDSFESGSTNS